MTARPVVTRPVLRRARQIHKHIRGAGQLAGARKRAPGRRRWRVQQLQAPTARRGEGKCPPAGRRWRVLVAPERPRRAAPIFTKSGSAVDQLASAVGAGSGDVLQLVIERRSMTARPMATRPPRATFTKQIPVAGQLAGARERAPGRRRRHVQQLQAGAAHRGGGKCPPAGRGGVGGRWWRGSAPGPQRPHSQIG